MKKGFTLLEVIVVIAVLALIFYVSMIALAPVQKGALINQTLSSEKTIGRVIMQLRTEGITVDDGKYSPSSFYNKYHATIPSDPLSYPSDTSYWQISGYNVYPIDFSGTELSTYEANGQTYTVCYDLSKDYPFFSDLSSSYYEPVSGTKEEYSMVGQDLVKNGDFSSGLLYWQYSNGEPILSVVSTPQNGNANYCIRMDGDTTKNFAVYQDIQLSGKAGDAFRVSYHAKPMYITQANCYECQVYIHYTDNGFEIKDLYPNKNNPQWQSGTVTVKTSKDYDYIRISLLLYEANGYTLFDDISVTKLSNGI